MVTSARYHVLFIAPYPELAEVVAKIEPDFPDLDVTIHEETSRRVSRLPLQAWM